MGGDIAHIVSNYRSRYAQDMKPREEDEEHKNQGLQVHEFFTIGRSLSLKVNNNRSNRGDEARVVIYQEKFILYIHMEEGTLLRMLVYSNCCKHLLLHHPRLHSIQDQNLLPTPRLHHHHNNVNLNVKLHHPRYHPNNKDQWWVTIL